MVFNVKRGRQAMSNKSQEDITAHLLAPTADRRRWRIVRKSHESKLPPPGKGKDLADLLDRIALTLTPEDLEDLDSVIRASRERPR